MSQPRVRVNPSPYGSARDLPTYRELSLQLRIAKMATRFVWRKHRVEVIEIQQGLDDLMQVVDDFYDRLGARNWVFHDSLDVDAVERLLAETSDASQAEGRLIELYREPETSKWWVMRLSGRDGLRQRSHQIERAYQHYKAGQFDSCVLHLIAVMDGFVNDFDPDKRKGLAARDPDEMAAWDSVVGHHMGLTHVLKTYGKTIKKRVDQEVFEVYRHGIVHGSVVSFDNEIVATKAWNMLFAVADWADATRKAAEPPEDPVTWRDVWSTLSRQATYKRYEDQFAPSTLTPATPEFAFDEVARRASEFLDAWTHGRWAIVAEFRPSVLRRSESLGEAARQTKQIFEQFDLTDWSIEAISYDHVSAAAITAAATVNGERTDLRFRMVFTTEDGKVAIPGHDNGAWTIAIWAPRRYLE